MWRERTLAQKPIAEGGAALEDGRVREVGVGGQHAVLQRERDPVARLRVAGADRLGVDDGEDICTAVSVDHRPDSRGRGMRTVELGGEGADGDRVGPVGEDYQRDVVSDVALALELLRIEREVGQERVDVEHDLVSTVGGVVRVLASRVF